MKLRNILFIILFINSTFLFSEESSLASHFFNDLCQLGEVKIIGYGTLEEQYISEDNYFPCWIFSIEKINEIDSFLYYEPREISPLSEYKIKINNQQFCFKDYSLFIPSIKLYSLCYEQKIYLILLSGIGKYGDKICFIFDITDPDNIKFYPPEERFVCKEVADNFAGIFQNKLCFLFSIWDSDTRLEYKLIPYYIEDNVLKMLCDEKGDAYYVRYYFLDRFEQQLVIEDVHLPDKR